MEAQMSLGTNGAQEGSLAVTRLGFAPSKLSAKSNRQIKISSHDHKRMKEKIILGESSKKKYLRNKNNNNRFKNNKTNTQKGEKQTQDTC
jgi:hypothetical protein